jgi:hypothetical protein
VSVWNPKQYNAQKYLPKLPDISKSNLMAILNSDELDQLPLSNLDD